MKKLLFLILVIISFNSINCFAQGFDNSDGHWSYYVDAGTYVNLDDETKGAIIDNGSGVYKCVGNWWYLDGYYWAFDANGHLKTDITIDGVKIDSEGYALNSKGERYNTPPGGSNSASGWNISKVLENVKTIYRRHGSYSSGASATAINCELNGISAKFIPDCSGFGSCFVYFYYMLVKNKSQLTQDIITNSFRFTSGNINKEYFSNKNISQVTNLEVGDILYFNSGSNGHVMMVAKVNQSGLTIYHWPATNPSTNQVVNVTNNDITVSGGKIKFNKGPNQVSKEWYSVKKINNTWPY